MIKFKESSSSLKYEGSMGNYDRGGYSIYFDYLNERTDYTDINYQVYTAVMKEIFDYGTFFNQSTQSSVIIEFTTIIPEQRNKLWYTLIIFEFPTVGRVIPTKISTYSLFINNGDKVDHMLHVIEYLRLISFAYNILIIVIKVKYRKVIPRWKISILGDTIFALINVAPIGFFNYSKVSIDDILYRKGSISIPSLAFAQKFMSYLDGMAMQFFTIKVIEIARINKIKEKK